MSLDSSFRRRLRTFAIFAASGDTAGLPEVHAHLERGARTAACILATSLSLLWATQIATGAEDPLRATIYSVPQLAAYLAVWFRLRRPVGSLGLDFLHYVLCTAASFGCLFGAWPATTPTNPYSYLGFLVPLAMAAFNPIRPALAVGLGGQNALLYLGVQVWAPYESMPGAPQAAVLAMSFSLGGALASHAQRFLHAELARARDRALEAARLKSQFLANVSHEIRTPMSAILGYADMIDEELTAQGSTPPLRQAALGLRTNGSALLHLMNNLVDLAQLEVDSMRLEPRPCELVPLIQQVVQFYEPAACEKGVALSFEASPELPARALVDAARLRQIAGNLTDNAVKFTARGEVRVRLEPRGASLRLTVEDTGIGLRSEDLTRIFDPFVQADGSLARRVGGSGMGLAISKRLTALMGGELAATSTPGEGSCFRLAIPLREVGACAPVEPRSGGPPPARLRNARILLAEDGCDNQRILTRILERAGARVDLAPDGCTAVQMAFAARDRRGLYDLILMDMQMPERDGYQATLELRRGGYAGPIVALTANVLDSDAERCLKCGCNGYASKPISRERLIELVLAHVKAPAAD